CGCPLIANLILKIMVSYEVSLNALTPISALTWLEVMVERVVTHSLPPLGGR
ncbi:hypothetical protein E2562_035511, partial [Oryza meyeriana var. granulata]